MVQQNTVKRLNITFVFSEPLNHAFITPERVVKVFAQTNGAQEKHNLIQAPNLLVLLLRESKKEIIFEQNRVLINDNSGVSPEESNIIDLADKVHAGSFARKDATSAEGYNFDLIITKPDATIEPAIFLPTDFSSTFSQKDETIVASGMKMRIQAKGLRKELQVELLNENSVLFHANYHYTGKIAENTSKRHKRFQKDYHDANKLAQKIEL